MKLSALCVAAALPAAAAAGSTFGAYFANWAQYHQPPYHHVADDVEPIAGRTDEILFSFVYFCPPAGTSPMPYWAVSPYGSCTDDSEFQLMTVESNDEASLQTLTGFKGTKVIASIGGWNFPSSCVRRCRTPVCVSRGAAATIVFEVTACASFRLATQLRIAAYARVANAFVLLPVRCPPCC
jgi:hypothetical protein